MFTGLVEAVGEITALEKIGGDLRIKVETGPLDLSDVSVGDSIAVNGVCLTAIELPGNGFYADVSVETLDNTTLRHVHIGKRVNLEKALLPTTRLGGHIVAGHVDGVGAVVSRYDDARSIRYIIEVPTNLAHYMAAKGSICIDGVSLTINSVDSTHVGLNIVPHTAAETTFGDLNAGDAVNIEVDLMARYMERMLLVQQHGVSGTANDEQRADAITRDMLNNFID